MAGVDSLLFGEQLAAGKRRSTITIDGSFETNGASDGPDWSAGTQVGPGYTVTRTGAGELLLTFDVAYPKLISCTCSAQADSVTDMQVQFGSFDASAKTLEIHTFVYDGDGLVVATDFDGPRVNFHLVFGRRSIS